MSISGEIRTSIRGNTRHFAPEEALINLKYALGIATEVAIAIWFLNAADGKSNWLAWIAYALFATSGLATVFGLFWYWLWFAERGFGAWYLAVVPTLIGIGLAYVGMRLSSDGLQILGFTLVYVLPLYCTWRLLKYVVVRVFRLFLVAVQHTGRAWRGE